MGYFLKYIMKLIIMFLRESTWWFTMVIKTVLLKPYWVRWGKLDSEGKILYDIPYIISKKKWYKWSYFQNKKRLTDLERIVREFRMVMYTLLYLKWITNKDLLIAHGSLLNVMCRQPGWEKGFWGRMDTCICMAESLPCSLETKTTLLISYNPTK